MKYSFVAGSGNAKTGPIPVTGTSKDSCPDSCPLKNNGCYAATGRLNIHWSRLDNKGLNLHELTDKIKTLAIGQLWRHNQMGDLPGKGEKIDAAAIKAIVEANKSRKAKGFTYTHKYKTKQNQELIKYGNNNDFTINLSANNLAQADELAKLDIGPVVTVLPLNTEKTLYTKEGRKVIVCPATYKEGVTCSTCALCQKQRSVIVGFPAHGISKNKVNQIASA